MEDHINENQQDQTPAEPTTSTTSNESNQLAAAEFEPIRMLCQDIHQELAKVIIGQTELIDMLIVALLCNGHVLLEGVPGVAKTLSARMLAKSLNTQFSRIQFTPDLMPSDVVGTSVYNTKSGDFTFKQGPVFSNFILVDEINRAPAKTQAALFEVMEEQQVTIDGQTYKMEFPFIVMATQNPVEQEGTYALPEAQLDRFFFKLVVDYPDLKEEISILKKFKNDFTGQMAQQEVKAVVKPKDLRKAMELVEDVIIKDELIDYIAKIIQETRISQDLFLGASPRASLAIMKSSKAVAAMNGRNFVTPDDIRAVTYHVLNHRIILTPEKEMEGVSSREVIDNIVKKIEVPR
jgi:MoxR-like ATPase